MGRRGPHFGSLRAPFWKYFGGRWPPFWVYFGGLGGFWLPSASLGRTREHYPFPGARFWVQVGLPDRAQIDQKSMQKTIKEMMPYKISFLTDLGGFLDGKWSQVGIKNDPKSTLTWENDFLKKLSFPLGKTMIWRILGIQVGSKKRSKIHKNMRST